MPPVHCPHCGAERLPVGGWVAERHCSQCGRSLPAASVAEAAEQAVRVAARFARGRSRRRPPLKARSSSAGVDEMAQVPAPSPQPPRASASSSSMASRVAAAIMSSSGTDSGSALKQKNSVPS